MRYRSWHFATLITLAINQLAHASEIIQPRDYHAHEAGVKRGLSWLALQPFKGKWRLLAAHPRFISIPDVIAGEGTRVKSDVKNALVLLADKNLKAGMLGKSLIDSSPSASHEQWYENTRLPNVGQARNFTLNGRSYTLKNTQGKLQLISAGLSQYLFDYSEEMESNAEIVWVGDLDRDGRLDLIIDASEHYNVGELRLYLSSVAPSGSLLKLVASRRTTGC